MLVLEGFVGLHRTAQLQLLQSFCGVQTWITVILNGLPWKQTDHSVIFETASKYCISDSFVDYDGYSNFFKGFLPAVVDVTVI